MTFVTLPSWKAVQMTPKAVPNPAVANDPVLQIVKTVASRGNNAAPCRPIAWLAERSSFSMAMASCSKTFARRRGWGFGVRDLGFVKVFDGEPRTTNHESLSHIWRM